MSMMMAMVLVMLMLVVVVHNVAPCTAVGLNGALSSAQGQAGGVYGRACICIQRVYIALLLMLLPWPAASMDQNNND